MEITVEKMNENVSNDAKLNVSTDAKLTAKIV